MNILLKPRPWHKMFLMDWEQLLPYWAKSDQYQTAMAKTPKIRNAYSGYWFGTDKKGVQRFQVGEVFCFGGHDVIHFMNGIHRTRVLANHSRVVPLCTDAPFYRSKTFRKCILRPISKDEIFELPDLPIMNGSGI